MLSKNDVIDQTTASKIFFWAGLFDPNDIAQHYEPIIEKLLDGDYQGLDLEKLDGYNVYSVRVNESDRLLFTTILVNNKPYLLLLDEVLNHDYAKSRFLKRGVLKHYLEVNGKIFSEEISRAHFKATEKLPAAASKDKNKSIDYARIDFFNQKYIELDPLQMGLATQTRLPLIISGAAGSGKSCIGLLILADSVQSLAEDKYPILYVTESEQLATHMQKIWQSLPLAQGLNANDVQFKSYKQLLLELEPETEHMTFVGKEHYLEWLPSYIKSRQTLAKTVKEQPLSEEFYSDSDKIYQEFRIISGCQKIEDYKTIGIKNSLFSDEKEQEWLYTAYTEYLKELENLKFIHTPFYRLPKKNQYKRIVADEAQDFSHLQLAALAELALDKQICYCEDNRQSLSDNKSKIFFLEKLFNLWSAEKNHVNLSCSYRCPTAPVNMANAVAQLKAMATDYGQPEIKNPPGQIMGTVKWLDRLEDSDLFELQQLALSPDFAVVTSKEYKEEAKELFKTLLVFTPEEIKGLEYKNILAYRLLDNRLFKEADKVIGEKSADFSKKSDNRAKKGQGKEHLGPLFNAFYTACTRTTDTLYVVQENHYYIKNIITHLKNALPKEQVNSLNTTSPSILNSEEQREIWFNETKIQLGQGNVGIAEEIFIGKLGKTAEDFIDLKHLFEETHHSPLKKSFDDQWAHTNIQVEKIHEEKSKEIISPKVELKTSNHPIAKQDKSKKSFTTKAVNTSKRGQTVVHSVLTPKKELPFEIKKLLKNVNKNTLTKFLQNPKAKEFLFSIPIKDKLTDEPCLFTRLFIEDYMIKALFYCMRMPEFQKLFIDIPASALCFPRGGYVASMFSNGPNHPEVKAKFKIWDERVNTSPLYWLASCEEGRIILKTLLQKNPGLADSIEITALLRKRNAESKNVEGQSPLDLLLTEAQLEDENSILELLSKHNPKLKDVINTQKQRKKREIGESCLPSKSRFFEQESLVKLLGGTDNEALAEYLATNFDDHSSENLEGKLLSSPSSCGLFSESSKITQNTVTGNESDCSPTL